jgi:hypothetical protein
MNDLDRDLREMFRRREGDVRVPVNTPTPVLRRTRRRQLGTVLTAAAVVVVVAATAIGGSSLLRDGGHTTPADQAGEGMRTTTSSYVTATYPTSWLATVDGRNMAMTNFDPGLGGEFCERIAGTMPPDGVALLILPDPTMAGAPPWPIPLAPDRSPGPCGAGPSVRSATWIASNGMSYRAIANAGPQAHQADVAALGSMFAGLAFPPGDGPAIDGSVGERSTGPGLVLDSGSVDGRSWNLVAFTDEFGLVMLEVEQADPFSAGGQKVPLTALDPTRLQTHVAYIVTDAGTHDSRTSGAVVYGAVGEDVARAEVVGSGPDFPRAPARIFAAPPSLRIPSRLVVGSVEGAVQSASVVGYAANGTPVGDPGIETGPAEPVAEGTDPLAGEWTVLVAPTTSGANLDVEDASGSGGGGSITPVGDGVFGGWQSGGDPMHIAGIVPSDVARVDVILDDGTTIPATVFALPDRFVGPANVFLAFASNGNLGNDGDLQAELVAYDANDTEVGRRSTSPGEPPGPTAAIDAAWTLLRSARDELRPYGSQHPFDDRLVATMNDAGASAIEYLADTDATNVQAQVGRVTVRIADRHHLVIVSRAETGEVYCVGIEISANGGGNFRYGTLNAPTYDDCSGGWS